MKSQLSDMAYALMVVGVVLYLIGVIISWF